MLTYTETLDFLYQQLPYFSRDGIVAYSGKLDTIIRFCEALGQPQNTFHTIHVAGTNGKGSSSHMLASILHEAGYSVGLYTSPHLRDFRERIRINGIGIEKEFVVDFVASNVSIIKELKPSFFELTVAMAYAYFASQKVHTAVIEVGVGGRLDSTNIITPQLSLITNISYDHMNILGKTLPEIAKEKAGIIKKNVPCVLSEYHTEIVSVIEEIAAFNNSILTIAENKYPITAIHQNELDTLQLTLDNQCITSNLTGDYQINNIRGVYTAARILQENPIYSNINTQTIQQGIANVTTNFPLHGRFEKIQENPIVIADIAHNEAGMGVLLKMIHTLDYTHLHIVIGMVADKDYSKVLTLLPTQAIYYFCQAGLARALDKSILQQEAQKYNLQGKVYTSVQMALQAAKNAAHTSQDIILVTGSNFVVAEI